MRYVTDRTGRFFERPHYEPKELDVLCESMLVEFFRKIGTGLRLPIATDDLTRLIEQDVSDFDGFADLSRYGDGVEGVTEFLPGRKPRVRIGSALAEDARRENRYRTTLTHEYGHVRLHAYLFDLERPRRDLDGNRPEDRAQICKRDTMVSASQTDWMEWQAGHVCGALLMPISHVKRVAGDFQRHHGIFGPIVPATDHGRALIDAITTSFQVSAEAARVRLLRLGYLGPDRGPSLFDR